MENRLEKPHGTYRADLCDIILTTGRAIELMDAGELAYLRQYLANVKENRTRSLRNAGTEECECHQCRQVITTWNEWKN